MPSHFIVSTHNETPKLYVAQHELGKIMEDLRGWTNNFNLTGWVYAAKKVTPWGSQLISSPPNHHEMALVGIIRPDSYVEQCMWAWGNQLDDEPYEQAVEHIQQMLDYVEKKKHRLEARNVQTEAENARKSGPEEEQPDNNQPQQTTTGP